MNMEKGSLFFIILLASSFLLKAILRKSREARKKLPPGPWKLPVIGNLHQVDPSKPHRSLLALSRRHGPLMLLRFGAVPTLIVSSRDVAEEIFRRHDLAFSGRPPLVAARKLTYNLSDVSFAPFGEYWRQARRIMVLELLSSTRVLSFQPIREQEVANLVASIKHCPSSSLLSNLSELTLSLANNVVMRAAFGGVHGEGGRWLHEVLSEMQQLVGSFWVGDLFPGMGWVDRVMGMRVRLEKSFEEMDRVFDKMIKEHLKEGEVEDNILQILLRLHKEAAQGEILSSMDQVKGILRDVFVGGTERAAATITWTMTELVKNPRVMIKLQQELQQSLAHKCKLIDETELEKLEYLKLVVKESLRLHPPVPLLPRETIEPCTIQGFHIPAKTRVLINAAAISTDRNVWDRPLEFWPERFLKSGAYSKAFDYAYMQFGAGRRSCPGMKFGLVLVELALANLLHCFDWVLPDGMEAENVSMEEALGLTMHKKDPLLLVAKPWW